MAYTDEQILGRMTRGPFETVGREESWAEQRNASVLIVGKFSDLVDKVRPGDEMSKFSSWFDGKYGSNWFVKNITLVSPDGVTGELRMSIQQCSQGKTRPFNVTWDIAMEEVQMQLINHPDVLKNCNIDRLLKWTDTPAGRRVKVKKQSSSNGDKYEYYYEDYDDQGAYLDKKKITNEWEIAYCNAVTQGITTYNKYLPVVVKNSYYLELPGVNYRYADHVITGGTLTDFTAPDAIGRFNEPDIKITGYTSQNGVWFKNCDKFTSQPDGTWVRTEGWVFTDDPRNKWIYTGRLDG